MALVVKDRVKETTTTTGTGTLTLAGAVTGFQSFSVIGNANTTYYTITDGTNWEVGIGTYTSSGTTLSRDTILESSNSGNAVNWGAGSKDVFVTYPAERSVYTDGAGTVITPATTSRLGFANLAQGSALSVLGVTGNATADNASIAAGTDNQVLRRSGTSVGFGAVNLASSDAVTGDLPFSNLAQGSALSVLGVTGNATADNASIAAGTDHQVLRRSGTSVAFGAVNLAQSAAITGTLPVGNGGTGQTTYTNGQLLIGNTTGNTLTKATLTAGTGISITNGTGSITIAASGGLSWQSVQTSDFTAVSNQAYPVNTTSAAITVTLPASPSAGDLLTFVDYAGTWDTNRIFLNPNGNKILGTTDERQLDGENEGISFVYIDSTQGWIPYSGFNSGVPPIATVNVDFLVIAGGGGTGFSGGGGAGGYRTSAGTSGGGASAESSLTLLRNTSYTVTVGAGGTASTTNGGNGSNSVFSTITSTGGGGGGSGANIGSAGGSGGGGGHATTSGAAGTANQGFAGGRGQTNGATYFNCGGGGGAGAVGNAAIAISGNTQGGGTGGVGVASSITGSSVTRAGGGGGSGFGANGGPGGTGGGGNGGGDFTTGAAGSVNTGGGGGGQKNNGTVGFAGGSGVVILKYPDLFTISNPGGGLTLSTAGPSGGFKVTTVTAGTGDVSFA